MAVRFLPLRTRFRRWFFALTAASALVLASGLAQAAGDADGDGVPDEVEAATERNVAVAVPATSPHSLSISSQSIGAETDDRFHLSYEAGTFEVEYFPDAATSQAASAYSLEFSSLVDWIDVDGDSQVAPSEIVVLRPLGKDRFGEVPIISVDEPSEDGGVINRFTIQSNFGEITFALTIARRFLRIPGEKILTPMEAKLDVLLAPGEVRVGALIGFQLRVRAQGAMNFGDVPWDVRHAFSTDESWISVTGVASNATVFFSWANATEVDGFSGEAIATPPAPDADNYTMYMFYPVRGSFPPLIQHTASLGVVSLAFLEALRPEAILGDPMLFALSIAAVAALVAVSMYVARRRRQL